MSALAFLCCKSNPDTAQNQRMLDCYVRILESEGQVLAQGTLKNTTATTPLPIEVPGGLRYQGGPMKVIGGKGLTYQTEFDGEYRPDHTFSWDDRDGTRHTFAPQMSRLSRWGFGSNTLTLGKPATFTWEGPALDRGETLVFMWENPKTNQAQPMEIYGGPAESKIEFPAAKLAELTPGTWTLYLVRRKLTKADANGVPAQATLEFYSQTDTLVVK
jgi:hypothetical protein